jgi:glucose-6-phosphate 1-dehydrogenase
LAAWDYIDPIISMVRKRNPEIYSPNSMGPEDTILKREGRHWFNPALDEDI